MAPSPDAPAPSPMSDAECIAAVRGGDAAALGALHARYWSELARYAERMTHVRAVADEVVQDVFLDLWRRRDAWSVRGSVRTYLFGAVHRRALHVLRHARVEDGWAARAVHEMPRSETPRPDAALDDEWLRERVAHVVDGLPERCREIFHLHYDGALRIDEIAELLGIAASTVRVQLHRAIQAIRAAVREAAES